MGGERPCSVRRRRLRPVGKRIRVIPESAAAMPSRESEVAVVPLSLGKTEGREGPLLPSIVQSWERQPDCPRKGRLRGAHLWAGPNRAKRKAPARLDSARKLQRAVQSELQLWLRRKHQCSWRSARKHWNYQFLYKRCRLYRMVGRVSHLPGLRRTPPEEDGRRAGCGKSARPVR